MKRKLFILILCVALISLTVGAIPASADLKIGAEIELDYDGKTVEVGERFTVTLYVQNITAPGGILGCDIPLYYDASALTLVEVEPVHPDCWGKYGIYVGNDVNGSDGDPYYLRSLCDANDAVSNSKYGLKDDKQLGYVLTFKAKTEGNTEITVKDTPASNDYIFVISRTELSNYGAEGDSVTITVGSQPESSVDDSSSESDLDSSSPYESSKVEDSSDESSELTSGEESEETSVNISLETDDESSESTETFVEDSEQESADGNDGSSEETIDDVSVDTTEDMSTVNESGYPIADSEDGTSWIYIVVAVLAILAVGGAVAGMLLAKRSAKKTEDEIDDETVDDDECENKTEE